MRWSRLVIVFVLVGSVSCAGGDGEPSVGLRDAIAEALAASADDPAGLQFADAEAECVAGGLLETFDAARLAELGFEHDGASRANLSQPPLTESESDQVFALYERCLDLEAQVAELFSADPALAPADARCIAGQYIESGLVQKAVLGTGFDAELNAQIDEAIANARTACGIEG